MKEIVFAMLAIILIAVAAAYGLDVLNWSAEGQFASENVRL